MTFKGHCIFALASIIIAKKINFLTSLENAEWGIVVLGSLLSCHLPDIDHHKSFISRRINRFFIYPYRILKHRGFTHSIFAVILYGYLVYNTFPSEHETPYQGLQDSLIIGYISHLVADIITPAGIQLLWPYHRRFCFPLLKNKYPIVEILFCVLFLVYSIIGVY
ncbi:metal-dependent hydrolase [Candidatus Liberibacter brunswickensis]|uniref:metal-dependent hydrolase n=1 Tax=Candidatus Liberibacter brunswickensis TaxID=1968796 RepID=UPI002FE2B992